MVRTGAGTEKVVNDDDEVRLQFSIQLADLVQVDKFLHREILDQDFQSLEFFFQS